MKKLLIALTLIIGSITSYAQANVDCIPEEYETDTELKEMEACVHEAANYIMSTPLTEVDEDYGTVLVMVITWMTKTPDYTFNLNSNMLKACKKNDVYVFLYMAAVAKAHLDGGSDPEGDAVKIFVEFIDNPRSRVKVSKKLQKVIDAYKSGSYNKYI